MSIDQILAALALMLVGVGGLWAVYGLVTHRLDQLQRDLGVVRDNYVRRDDFLRVVDRFEAKVDQLLKALSVRPPTT